MTKTISNSVKFVFIAIMVCFLASSMVFGVCYAIFTKDLSATKTQTPATMGAELYNVSYSSPNYTIGTQYAVGDKIIIQNGATETSKTIALKNTSTLNVVMRVKPVVVWQDDSGETIGYPTTSDYTLNVYSTPTTDTINGSVKTYAQWTLQDNGYYYYNSAMDTDDYAPFGTAVGVGSGATIPAGATNMRIILTVEVTQTTGGVFEEVWKPCANMGGEPFFNGSIVTPDGINHTVSTPLIAFKPNNATWENIAAGTNGIANSPLLLDYTQLSTGNVSATIPQLTGTGTDNSYLLLYNNSPKPMIATAIYTVFLMVANDNAGVPGEWKTTTISDALWSVGGAFADTKLTISHSSDWVDVRKNAIPNEFTSNNECQTISYAYNRIVYPGESISALTNSISLTDLPSDLTAGKYKDGKFYTFRIMANMQFSEATYSEVPKELFSTADDTTGIYNKYLVEHKIPANFIDDAILQTLLDTYLPCNTNQDTSYSYWLARVRSSLGL